MHPIYQLSFFRTSSHDRFCNKTLLPLQDIDTKSYTIGIGVYTNNTELSIDYYNFLL